MSCNMPGFLPFLFSANTRSCLRQVQLGSGAFNDTILNHFVCSTALLGVLLTGVYVCCRERNRGHWITQKHLQEFPLDLYDAWYFVKPGNRASIWVHVMWTSDRNDFDNTFRSLHFVFALYSASTLQLWIFQIYVHTTCYLFISST